MSPTIAPHSTRPTRTGGFVLVSVLLIVALATMLVVVASMMSQIERKAAANSTKTELARANALFALDVALNQLQTAAGPDQRVTARAEILDATNAPPLSTNNSVKQPLWTGVWKTGTNHLDVGSSPQRVASLGGLTPTTAEKAAKATWLVSGTNVDPTSFSGVTTGTNATAAVLARNFGTNSISVAVPLVPVVNSGKTNGAYAYWVSDEGVKAKVNQTDPTSGATTLPENQLHFFTPQATIQSKGLLGANNTTDLRSSTNSLSKVTTLVSLQNVAGIAAGSLSGTNSKVFAADATTCSLGVLADVRKGGLKKDLTAAFEDTGATAGKNYAKLNPNGTARVYSAPSDTVGSLSSTANTTLSTTGMNGLSWLSLYNFYNLYKGSPPVASGQPKNVNAQPASGPAGIGNPAAALPLSVAPRGIGWTDPALGTQATQVSYGMLAPAFLGYRWDVSLSQKSAGLNPGNGKQQYTLQLNYYFQFILYNPYTVALKSPLSNFRMGRALAAAGNIYLATTVAPAPGSPSSPPTNYYYTALNLGATLQRMLFISSLTDTASLEPGEIRVFGLTSNINAGSVQAACEYKPVAAPYGFNSIGFAPTFRSSADLQRISSVFSSNGTADPSKDTYVRVPDIDQGSLVSLRLSTAPASPGTTISDTTLNLNPANSYTVSASGSADTSIPSATMWQTDGGSGGSVLPSITGTPGSGGRRTFQSGAPGSISTGSSGSVTRPVFGPLPIENITETQLLSMFIRVKGVNPTGGAQYANASWIVPYFQGNSSHFNMIFDANSSKFWNEFFISNNNAWPSYPPPTSELQLQITPTSHTTTSWGERSTGVDLPDRRIVLCDVPIQPMISLGQFMHMQLIYMMNTGAYTSLSFGSMFTGGSYASPELNTLDVSAYDFVSGTQSTLVLDHSFLANQALFDSYFFSTVPPSAGAPSGTTWPAYWTQFNSANSGARLSDPSKPLLNARIKPVNRNGQPPLMSDLRDMDKAAANLMLDGAFNVNSTSVPAWKALLSSLSGNTISLWDATGRQQVNFPFPAAGGQNPILRFWSANSDSSSNSRWSGVRSLSDAEIQTLAEKIVEQVKTRGPFLSMADFLNRRLAAANSDLSRAGALQTAIDKTTLNNSIKTGSQINLTQAALNAVNIGPKPQLTSMYDVSSASGVLWDSAIGVPGYLMQQDLVQSFSPVMSARSDTFILITYGEVRNPATGVIEGLAYGEAVVQRLPEYVDAAADPNPEVYPPTSQTNLSLGRRFKVISFRWLNPNEI